MWLIKKTATDILLAALIDLAFVVVGVMLLFAVAYASLNIQQAATPMDVYSIPPAVTEPITPELQSNDPSPIRLMDGDGDRDDRVIQELRPHLRI
jgi:hypothetical protein